MFSNLSDDELKSKGILSDQVIDLHGKAKMHYQGKKMYLARFWNSIHHIKYEFLTNNFTWKYSTIVSTYKVDWR